MESPNFSMVREGYAYPMYYDGAFHELRATFDKASLKPARAIKRGVWDTDSTLHGFQVPPPEVLTEQKALCTDRLVALANFESSALPRFRLQKLFCLQ